MGHIYLSRGVRVSDTTAPGVSVLEIYLSPPDGMCGQPRWCKVKHGPSIDYLEEWYRKMFEDKEEGEEESR